MAVKSAVTTWPNPHVSGLKFCFLSKETEFRFFIRWFEISAVTLWGIFTQTSCPALMFGCSAVVQFYS